MKKRFTEELTIGFLRKAQSGLPVTESCRRYGFSGANYCYIWYSKFGGVSVSGPGGPCSEHEAKDVK